MNLDLSLKQYKLVKQPFMLLFDYPFNKRESILLLRHAEREAFKTGFFGNEVPLTKKGRNDAYALGRNLAKFQWREVYSSPLLRCSQTAQIFLEGAEQKTSVTLSKALGDPGIFIFDPQKAGRFFLEKPLSEIIETIYLEKPLPGMRGLREGVEIFKKFICSINSFPCLLISHDITVSLLMSYFDKQKPKIPGYLEGFVIENEE